MEYNFETFTQSHGSHVASINVGRNRAIWLNQMAQELTYENGYLLVGYDKEKDAICLQFYPNSEVPRGAIKLHKNNKSFSCSQLTKSGAHGRYKLHEQKEPNKHIFVKQPTNT